MFIVKGACSTPESLKPKSIQSIEVNIKCAEVREEFQAKLANICKVFEIGRPLNGEAANANRRVLDSSALYC